MDHTPESTDQPARRGPLAGLWQRLRAQKPPEPFRDSDFESSEWTFSAFDPQPGRAE